jgi:CheY-like chemotaxis protein
MYACLRVIDSGVGMDRLTCDRIFEPFFTTKRSSGGTGLGLAFVHSIVSNHGGAITVNSAPSVGTTFTIYLPKAPVVATSEPELHTPSVAGRGRRVLYVDDEQPIVALMTEQLERSDFRVTGLTSAHVALTAIRAAPHNYDIVVCDYNMPKMSGLELLQELLTLRPDLPCILISGFVDEGLQTAAGAVGVTQIVQKPQSPAELCVLIDALTATVRHLPPHLASTF